MFFDYFAREKNIGNRTNIHIFKIDDVLDEVMKMEVLPVQNQFQTPFGVSKIKDWTRPLTPPATNRHHRNHHHGELKSSSPKTASQITSSTPSKTAIKSNHSVTNSVNHSERSTTKYSNNNKSTAEQLAADYANELTHTANDATDETALQSLMLRLQNELRRAKSQHLACTEVLLPADLLNRIATEMVVMSEKEPCGIRGSTIYIEFEDEPNNTRRIASLQMDPNTVSTFELYLTLRQDRSGWTSILPQFLKNLARSSTIMISPDFLVTKNKLFRSFSE